MCLYCFHQKLGPVWRCTEIRHFLYCFHVVDTQPSDCAHNCRDVPRAQPRIAHHDCRICNNGQELFAFLHGIYPIERLEDELLAGLPSLPREEIEAMRVELRSKKTKLRQRTPRIFWLAYSRSGSWNLYKLLWLYMRAARRRERADRRQRYKRWVEYNERRAALYFAEGLHWLLKEMPNVAVTKMSDRPSRFEDYLRLRAETKEPYELTELRYRIAVVDKIMLKCGYGPTTAWDNADPDLLDIWNHLVMDGDPCLAESLPLDVLEHLEDIMTKYEDAPIGLQDGITEQAQDLIDSEDEFEDEIDEEPYLGDSFWGRLNGSMDLLQFLGVQPFGRRTDAVAALIGLLIGNLSPPADANWTSLGVGPVGVDAPDEALYELLQTSYTGPLVPDSPLSGSPEPGSPVPGLPDSILSDSGSQESMDFPQPPIYRPQLTRNRRHDDDYVPSDSSDELDFL